MENDPNLPTVTLNGALVQVELAVTSDAVKKGLSGRPSLAMDRGMLFVFPKPSLYRFWMLNMLFPIDIIWINENKVVSVNANVHPTFDAGIPLRRSFFGWLLRRRRPIFYFPERPAQYVLEVNAGFAARHDIVPDNAVVFTNIPTRS
jgi:uncharacterized membrane protein (UPF0127 family)